jgi:histone acetyltransferase (RNA polymerase elongator complex component)
MSFSGYSHGRESMMENSFELGPIRPPSEAYSLLIRATINCPWNRCQFCHTYKGRKFELRPVAEIKQDITTAKLIQDRIKETTWQSGYGGMVREVAARIANNPPNEVFRNVALWLYGGAETAFLQDANTLIMKTHDLVEVIRFLKETLPSINRITSYARSKTAAKKSLAELRELHKAGLSRLHIGLESGYDPLLQYMDKGVTAADHITGGKKVVESGISLSEYVLLGLGGKQMWRDHAIETARVLSQIDPDFIRVRTLVINNRMPLYDKIETGDFIRATDEEIIEEEKLLIENLECHSNFVSDHINNLLQEIEGKLPQDKEKMLAIINRFQALSPEERVNFKVGRRAGIYQQLDDLNDLHKHEIVNQLISQLSQDGNEVTEQTIYALMERFI